MVTKLSLEMDVIGVSHVLRVHMKIMVCVRHVRLVSFSHLKVFHIFLGALHVKRENILRQALQNVCRALPANFQVEHHPHVQHVLRQIYHPLGHPHVHLHVLVILTQTMANVRTVRLVKLPPMPIQRTKPIAYRAQLV